VARILLVEDNEMNRDMLSRRLQRKGYDVTIAVDGAEAIKMIDSEPPDLILMDMTLPGMSGAEATQTIRQSASMPQVPIVALTASAMTGDRERALAAGCDDYDTKPVDLTRLLGKIETLLARR
jgi:CheY-like chemotaxis protein